MRLKNKIFLSIGALWIAFLCVFYAGTHTYLLNQLLRLEGRGDNQDIIVSHYAINQVLHDYSIAFIFFSLLFAIVTWYLLNSVFLKYFRNFENQLRTMQADLNDVKPIQSDEKNEFYFLTKQFNQMIVHIKTLRENIADERKKTEELSKKVQVLGPRAAETDKVDGIFHSVTDRLNTIGTSLFTAKEKIECSKAEKLMELAAMLVQQKNNLADFITQDPGGQRVPEYLVEVAREWIEENHHLLREFVLVEKNLMDLKQTIQDFHKM